MTGDGVARSGFFQYRSLELTTVEDVTTARAERAAADQLQTRRHAAFNPRQRLTARAGPGQCGEEPLRVGMLRRAKEIGGARSLGNRPGIQHCDAITRLRDDAEVVSDQQ